MLRITANTIPQLLLNQSILPHVLHILLSKVLVTCD